MERREVAVLGVACFVASIVLYQSVTKAKKPHSTSAYDTISRSSIASIREQAPANLDHSDTSEQKVNDSANSLPTLEAKTNVEFTRKEQSTVLSRDQWIVSSGLLDNFREIRDMFTPEKLADMFPARYQDSREFIETRADYYAQELATIFSADSIRRMEQKRIDVLRAYTSPNSLEDRILRTELLVEAKFFSAKVDDDLGDGFLSTLVFEIDKVIKGQGSVHLIHLREPSGIRSDGLIQVTPGGLINYGEGRNFRLPQAGTRFLLAVSKGTYPLRAIETGGVPVGGPIAFSIAQTELMRIEGDVLVPIAGSVTRRPFAKTLSELYGALKTVN